MWEIHLLCFPEFQGILILNPHVDKIVQKLNLNIKNIVSSLKDLWDYARSFAVQSLLASTQCVLFSVGTLRNTPSCPPCSTTTSMSYNFLEQKSKRLNLCVRRDLGEASSPLLVLSNNIREARAGRSIGYLPGAGGEGNSVRTEPN